MKKTILLVFYGLISSCLFAQNWVQVGDLNSTPRVMLNDTFSGQLLISGNFRFNGADTLDGFCAYDGATFISLGRRFDCVSFGCNPAFMIARYQEQLYLSGPNLTIVDSVDVKGVGKWDGTKWSAAMPGLNGEIGDNPYLDDYCIHDGRFYSVGLFRTADGDTCNSVAYWNGQKWTGLGFIPYPNNGLPRVFKVIFYQDQLYVAGNFSWEVSGGQDIAHLTNTGWELVGGGLKGGFSAVFDIEVYRGDLYICGRFRKADGNVGDGIMRWDGNAWREVGAGFCNPAITATAMMVHKDQLYVVGIFDCVGNGLPVSNIAVWDGEHWCSFGDSYFDNTITCITEYKGGIYIGGGFEEVDGQPCRYLAKWVGDHSTDICSDPISAAPEPGVEGFSLSPNPSTSQLHLQAPAPIESLWIFDALGRQVLHKTGSSPRETLSVEHLPGGLYFVSLRAGEKVWRATFVKE